MTMHDFALSYARTSHGCLASWQHGAMVPSLSFQQKFELARLLPDEHYPNNLQPKMLSSVNGCGTPPYRVSPHTQFLVCRRHGYPWTRTSEGLAWLRRP